MEPAWLMVIIRGRVTVTMMTVLVSMRDVAIKITKAGQNGVMCHLKTVHLMMKMTWKEPTDHVNSTNKLHMQCSLTLLTLPVVHVRP
jgi:hypothetical protein